MRCLNSATLIAAAAQICRKRLLKSVPICDSSHRSLSAVAGFGKSRRRAAPTYKMKRLPADLSASGNVAELTCDSAACGGVCHVYLLGTLHGTQKSCDEVKALIEFVKPQVVFVELCPIRAHNLQDESVRGEFHVANEEALKYGAKFVLGDRPVDITRDRIGIMAHWELLISPLIMSCIRVIHMITNGVFGKDELQASDLAPSYYETMINERDQYMSAKLLEVSCRHNLVVAVVGKAHLRGIQKYWKQPVHMKQLLYVPTKTRMVTYIRRILNL